MKCLKILCCFLTSLSKTTKVRVTKLLKSKRKVQKIVRDDAGVLWGQIGANFVLEMKIYRTSRKPFRGYGAF